MSSAAEQQLFLHHLPRLQRSVFNHCQPLQPTALTSISHFIVTSQFSALAGSALLGVPWRFSAISMLTYLDVHRSQRCLQRCSQDSQRWQPQRAAAAGAGGRAMGWTTPPHHNILIYRCLAIYRYVSGGCLYYILVLNILIGLISSLLLIRVNILLFFDI